MSTHRKFQVFELPQLSATFLFLHFSASSTSFTYLDVNIVMLLSLKRGSLYSKNPKKWNHVVKYCGSAPSLLFHGVSYMWNKKQLWMQLVQYLASSFIINNVKLFKRNCIIT